MITKLKQMTNHNKSMKLTKPLKTWKIKLKIKKMIWGNLIMKKIQNLMSTKMLKKNLDKPNKKK